MRKKDIIVIINIITNITILPAPSSRKDDAPFKRQAKAYSFSNINIANSIDIINAIIITILSSSILRKDVERFKRQAKARSVRNTRAHPSQIVVGSSVPAVMELSAMSRANQDPSVYLDATMAVCWWRCQCYIVLSVPPHGAWSYN
ncbi:hypothetical protein VTO58DRAFT_103931 [Aureobasidium pullulans]